MCSPQKMKMLKIRWFYCVVAKKNLSKMIVLNILDAKKPYKTYSIKNFVDLSNSCTFSENPCAKIQKAQKIY